MAVQEVEAVRASFGQSPFAFMELEARKGARRPGSSGPQHACTKESFEFFLCSHELLGQAERSLLGIMDCYCCSSPMGDRTTTAGCLAPVRYEAVRQAVSQKQEFPALTVGRAQQARFWRLGGQLAEVG